MKILSEHNTVLHIQLFHRTKGMQNIKLLLMHILTKEGGRLFHGCYAQDLKQMILHHIL